MEPTMKGGLTAAQRYPQIVVGYGTAYGREKMF